MNLYYCITNPHTLKAHHSLLDIDQLFPDHYRIQYKNDRTNTWLLLLLSEYSISEELFYQRYQSWLED